MDGGDQGEMDGGGLAPFIAAARARELFPQELPPELQNDFLMLQWATDTAHLTQQAYEGCTGCPSCPGAASTHAQGLGHTQASLPQAHEFRDDGGQAGKALKVCRACASPCVEAERNRAWRRSTQEAKASLRSPATRRLSPRTRASAPEASASRFLRPEHRSK